MAGSEAPQVNGSANSSMKGWESIGVVVGNTSTSSYSFILRSYQGKLGDIVATRTVVPGAGPAEQKEVTVWGRIVSIDRFNPFFPAEAAQELADQSIRFLDTVLSRSRDHLEAEVLILGTTSAVESDAPMLSPLTYPVKPSAEVTYPPAEEVRRLLLGADIGGHRLRIGSLIAREDVDVSLSARHVVSRHLAILAMTGGGKTVAARRILRELIDIKYPLLIFDPHGDYLGFYEKQGLFNGTEVRVLYPAIRVRSDNVSTIAELIDKMGRKLTDAQQQLFHYLINSTVPNEGELAATFIQRLIDHSRNVAARKREGEAPEELRDTQSSTFNAVQRSLEFVMGNLQQMEKNNERLRGQRKLKDYEFVEMPDPKDAPEELVRPGRVSVVYLAGYDHLNQSAIVSIVLEALFAHRATLSDIIPPFQAVIEEAHNFVPSRVEGRGDTPSLATIRKVITEGRKFGTGLMLISQRPSRLDETTLSQCNSFLVLRLVNPKDKSFVRSVMENLSQADADILQTFGPGQGIVSGQAVEFPLLVKVGFDKDLVSDAIGDEDFVAEAARWKVNPAREATSRAARVTLTTRDHAPSGEEQARNRTRSRRGRRARVRPEGFD